MEKKELELALKNADRLRIQELALVSMVKSGDAELKEMRFPSGRKKIIYKVKPYVEDE